MEYIGLNINSSKDKEGRILEEVRACVSRVFTDSKIVLFKDSDVEDKKNLDKIEMMITLGGDGTIIRNARAVCKYNIPIFGVNFGNLGFLASIEKSELEKALLEIKENNYKVEERIMLECELIKDEECLVYGSLNDIVLSRKYQLRILFFFHHHLLLYY